MRIIKKGKLPEERLFKVVCRNCSTEFEFTQGEAKMNYPDRPGEGNSLSIECPVCNHTVWATA